MKYWSININGKSLTVNLSYLICGSILVITILFSSVFSLFQLVNSNLNASKFINRKKKQEILVSALQRLENKLSAIHKSVDSLVDWDRKVRLVWGIPEINEDIRKLGVGGREFNWSGDIVDRVGNTAEDLKKKLDFELASCTEISKNINQVKSLLSATPSIWPTAGTVTSSFGWRYFGGREFHAALDIANNVGTPVMATASGIVVSAERKGGLGLIVEIDHGYGYVTRYGHLARFPVTVGQKVERGDIIGFVGNTGYTTGPHLHYEVRIASDKAVNPLSYIIPGNTTY